MNARHPALRVALFAVLSTVVGFVVVAVWQGIPEHRYVIARQHADVVVDGSVVRDGIGDTGDIRVRWRDQAGHDHAQRFEIYDTDRYVKGATFRVAYNSRHREARAFPADPAETATLDDFRVPVWLYGAGAAVLVLAWAARGLLFRRALARPSSPASATAFSRTNPREGLVHFGDSLWLRLQPRYDQAADPRWQRVMWHPAVDTLTGATDALVHGDLDSRRRVVVQTADGSRLVPIGRLRRKPPARHTMTAREDSRRSIADSFIVPDNTLLDSSRPWWRRGLVLGTVGLLIGVAAGVAIAGPDTAVPFAAGFCAFVVNWWAAAGAEP